MSAQQVIRRRDNNGVEITIENRGVFRLDFAAGNICRVRFSEDGWFSPSALCRYGFIKQPASPVKFTSEQTVEGVILTAGQLRIAIGNDSRLRFMDLSGNCLLEEALPAQSRRDRGGKTCFVLPKPLAFFGLGDQTRERIEHRGTQPELWMKNVTGYIPIPFLMTSGHYALLINTTRRVAFDLGKRSTNEFGFEVARSTLDYYFISADSLAALIEGYTALTGRPPLPPRWTFGLWFVCHKDANAHEMLDNCRDFRREGIPCDAIGLEPGWMEKHYDLAIDKKWNPRKFFMPSWKSNEQTNFLGAARNMGFKPGLWLCMNYDLSWEEERRLKKQASKQTDSAKEDADPYALEQDEHLQGAYYQDEITKPDQPWYEHLKKFVDQGVEYFKMDGCAQVSEHPDRAYANGMKDDEMHNLYPLFYSRQMWAGFREHTGRRAAILTPCGWAGAQRFPGAWTGDTGGGIHPLVACLNLSLSGHTYHTCDMDNTNPAGIHFGFLLPWAQLNSWAYWKHPWFLPAKPLRIFKAYARLRYRLVPYLYSQAYTAWKTGLPIMRPLPLVFPDDPKARTVLHEYMLGDAFLVVAFDQNRIKEMPAISRTDSPEVQPDSLTQTVYLPGGEWFDYWTGERISGSKEFTYTPPPERGGGLFVRAGAIIPMGPECDHIGAIPEAEITLDMFVGANADFTLYEDDGISYGYEKGEHATTTIRMIQTEKNEARITIAARQGRHHGMPPTRRYVIRLHGIRRPNSVSCDGKPLNGAQATASEKPEPNTWTYVEDRHCLIINPACAHGEINIAQIGGNLAIFL